MLDCRNPGKAEEICGFQRKSAVFRTLASSSASDAAPLPVPFSPEPSWRGWMDRVLAPLTGDRLAAGRLAAGEGPMDGAGSLGDPMQDVGVG
jgi:hypothetical protein